MQLGHQRNAELSEFFQSNFMIEHLCVTAFKMIIITSLLSLPMKDE